MGSAPFCSKDCSELDREANIAKNRALFEDLGLKQAINSLSTAPAKAPAKPVQNKRIKRERPDEILAPRRQSQRLMKKTTDADETPEEKQLRDVR